LIAFTQSLSPRRHFESYAAQKINSIVMGTDAKKSITAILIDC
jgi:hypothetical protein